MTARRAASSRPPRPPNRERERPRALVPVGALEDPGLALDPAAVRRLDVLAVRREDVEDEPPRREEQLAGGGERCQPVVLRHHVQEGAERDHDERYALADRRLAHVALAEVDEPLDALGGAKPARDLEHPRRESTPMTGMPAFATGTAIRPVPHASSTTGPPDANASST